MGEKIKVTITALQELQSITAKDGKELKLLNFTASAEDNSSRMYECWSGTLQKVIQENENKQVELEYTHSQKESGENIYHHYKVTQVWVGGEPVKQQSGGYGRGAYDPNKDKGVALSYAVELAKVGKIELKEIKAYATKFVEFITKGE